MGAKTRERSTGWRRKSAVEVELIPEDLRDINEAASKITVQGARYPEKLEQMTGR